MTIARFARDLGFGATVTAGGPHALPPVGAGAGQRVGRDRGRHRCRWRPSRMAGSSPKLPCAAGSHYRYRLADGTVVPDPASRFQPEDVHGPSQVVDPRAYGWQHGGWAGRPWHEVVLYEAHVGCLGGFGGVARALPALKELGITAVELMPIADFPGRHNWGYDGVFPFAPTAPMARRRN